MKTCTLTSLRTGERQFIAHGPNNETLTQYLARGLKNKFQINVSQTNFQLKIYVFLTQDIHFLTLKEKIQTFNSSWSQENKDELSAVAKVVSEMVSTKSPSLSYKTAGL